MAYGGVTTQTGFRILEKIARFFPALRGRCRQNEHTSTCLQHYCIDELLTEWSSHVTPVFLFLLLSHVPACRVIIARGSWLTSRGALLSPAPYAALWRSTSTNPSQDVLPLRQTLSRSRRVLLDEFQARYFQEVSSMKRVQATYWYWSRLKHPSVTHLPWLNPTGDTQEATRKVREDLDHMLCSNYWLYAQ